MDVRDRRVTVMGLGRHGGGLGVVRYLVNRGARVLVTDVASEATLAESLRELSLLDATEVHVGGHAERDFREADLVVVNPAVPRDHPMVAVAEAAGATVTNEIDLLLDACDARAVGVTGSNGKSTTAAMIAQIFASDGRRAWLGGNIGGSLLPDVDQIGGDDWLVLELSSFQLARMATRPRFAAVAITHCTANHLDWHGDFDHYLLSKRRILELAGGEGTAVFDPTAPGLEDWVAAVRGRHTHPWPTESVECLAVPGEHNRVNASLAAATAEACGCGKHSIRRGLCDFRGLEHRLELVGEVAGRTFINDSAATTPESTMAALDAMDAPVWLVAGGYDKRVPLEALASAIRLRTRGAAFYGAMRRRLRDWVGEGGTEGQFETCETMGEAVRWCYERSGPGEVILLSPACASHDQFADYRDRGDVFRSTVGDLVRSTRRAVA